MKIKTQYSTNKSMYCGYTRMLKKYTYEDCDHGYSPHKYTHLVCILLRTATLIAVLIHNLLCVFSKGCDHNRSPHKHNLIGVFSEDCNHNRNST